MTVAEPKPGEAHISTLEGRWGKVSVFNTDRYIGQSFLNYGEYNADETEFVVSLAQKAGKDKLVLDIGANIGAIGQALEHSGFTVESFEPQPEVFNLLTRNVKGKCHNIALASRAGKTVMPKIRYDEVNNFGGISIGTTSKAHGGIEVQVETLDSFNFQNVGLIKIDVEGFEEEVLRGAVNTIMRCSPILYLEDDRAEKSDSLYKFLTEIGYMWHVHRPPLYRDNNFFAKKENIWGKNYVSKNIVCVKYPL
ncbi:MAG TPA: FkbM family methyltransferase [Patescibacteria group bacterium]|nr:FkbM family methyltransferase [Patescibacteria group bacterium]